MTTYRVVKNLADGLIRIERSDADSVETAMWDRTQVRKKHTCAATGREILPGQQAYRPASNTAYRHERIAADVIDGTGERKESDE